MIPTVKLLQPDFRFLRRHFNGSGLYAFVDRCLMVHRPFSMKVANLRFGRESTQVPTQDLRGLSRWDRQLVVRVHAILLLTLTALHLQRYF